MSLKRTVYHFAGKDYEASDRVTLTFYVQRVSINNFLNLNYSASAPGLIVRNCKYTIGEFAIDPHHTNIDAAIKPITIECSAAGMFLICNKLGMREYHNIETSYLYVRNIELRAVQTVKHERYNGFHVFDPTTKRSWFTSNTPNKIIDQQAVINGKLWRKYITKL